METNKTRIIFVCPDIEKPSGGIKQIYRQVDILSSHGFNAYILHKTHGFRCEWFQNNTPIIYNYKVFEALEELKKAQNKSLKQILKALLKKVFQKLLGIGAKQGIAKISNRDILVFPEIYGPNLSQILPENKKVIYNQGVYQTFFGYDLDLNKRQTPYTDKNLIAVLVNSEDAKDYINLAFPKLKVYRVKYGFDHHKFSYPRQKKKQITFMTRRLHADILQVINILKFRNALENWSILPIENMNEFEVAQSMQDSAIFLSFNINEGFGMPPAEAMACGCLVVGYPGFGGKEIFKKEFSYPVPDRDVQSFVKVLEELIIAYSRDSVSFQEKSIMASDFILKHYSLDKEKRTVLEAWNHIIKQVL